MRTPFVAAIAAVICSTALIAAPPPPADWLTDGGDPQRTGWQRNETILNKDNVKGLAVRWKTKLDNEPREMHSLFPPMIASNIPTRDGPKEIAIEAGSSDNIYGIDTANRDEVTAILAAPHRIGVAGEVVRRTLDGMIKVAPDGTVRASDRYLLVGRKGATRPDPVQAAWLYAQMVRWGQTPMSADGLRTAMAVFRPDLYDTASGHAGKPMATSDPIGAFAGPAFDPADIAGHLAAFAIGRQKP